MTGVTLHSHVRYKEIYPQKAAHVPLEPLTGKIGRRSHGARPVHLIITMIKWIRTSRLSIKNSLSRAQVCMEAALAALRESLAAPDISRSVFSSSSLFFSSLELSDTTIYEP